MEGVLWVVVVLVCDRYVGTSADEGGDQWRQPWIHALR